MSATFNESAFGRYYQMIQACRETGCDAIVWANLMWLTETGIADHFRFADCCESITGASDPCPCSLIKPFHDDDDYEARVLDAVEAAECDLMSSFAYWRMLPSEVQEFAISDWLNGTSVETPVFQNTDAARLFVIENACHQFGYADSEDATFGKCDE